MGGRTISVDGGWGGVRLALPMALLRKLFWLAIFLAATLSVVVLFEKGTTHFIPNLQKQAQDFGQLVREQFLSATKTGSKADKP